MPLTAIYANLSCSDLERSIEWYALLFERKPDARPMDGLAEWHHTEQSGFQLYEDAKYAGRGTLTLIVRDPAAERSRLSASGMLPGKVEEADYLARPIVSSSDIAMESMISAAADGPTPGNNCSTRNSVPPP